MNVWQKFKGWIAKKMNFTVETSPAMKEESFLEWLGVKRKNKDVMAEVTYFTCLKMMSETLAKIPWKYYQKTDKGIIEPELSDVAKLQSILKKYLEINHQDLPIQESVIRQLQHLNRESMKWKEVQALLPVLPEWQPSP